MKKLIKKIMLKRKNKSAVILSDNVSLSATLGQGVRVYNEVFVDDKVSIGDYTYLSPNSKVYADVEIGKFCSIGPNVVIAPGEHDLSMFTTHPIAYDKSWNDSLVQGKWATKKTIIGNDVWIGYGAIIKQGVKIGNGAVIGFGSIVTKDVEDYAIVAGNPAKVIRYREVDTEKFGNWYNKSIEEIKALINENIEK